MKMCIYCVGNSSAGTCDCGARWRMISAEEFELLQRKGNKVETEKQIGFDSWAIVELMGHVKMAGRLREEERFGAKMGRVDIPGPNPEQFVTQYFGGSSVYRITPCTEDTARRVATLGVPAPVSLWQLPELPRKSDTTTADEDEVEKPFEEDNL